MIFTKKQAKKLGYSMTIDLREMNAREYLEKKHPLLKFQNTFLKYFGIVWLIWFVIICAFGWGIFQVEASEKITYQGMLDNSSVEPPFWIYSQLKDECYKQEAKDKKHCIKTGLAIAYAESSWKDTKTPFGLQSKDKSYAKWVSSYKKYWHTAKHMSFFYGSNGKEGKSHYCLSEDSSGTDGWCPNWLKNSQVVYESIWF